MLEPARIETAIQLISQCEAAWSSERKIPADIILHQHFKASRFMGSKDRAAIAELVYFIIRNKLELEWWCVQHGLASARALVLTALATHRGLAPTQIKALFNGEKFNPAPLNRQEEDLAVALKGKKLLNQNMPEYVQHNVPEWMLPYIQSALGEDWKTAIGTLNEEAPVDLRANTLLTTRDELLVALNNEGFQVEATRLSPIGIRMQKRAPIFTSKHFKEGWFEMQDEGSQLVSLMANAKPGDRVIDFCAGAGGKTLAMAAEMKNKGRILAWDTSETRLNQMSERLRRAKVDNVQRHLLESERDEFLRRHYESADVVVIDAPCSGSGTWRRNPDLKWRTTKVDLEKVISVQQKILHSASRLVKAGGHLLYITCSFFTEENEQQIETFLSQSKKFRVVTSDKICSKLSKLRTNKEGMLRLMPHQDGTDGFFATMMQRVE